MLKNKLTLFNKTTNIENIDKKHIWHPYTQMKDYENIAHLAITKAKGPYIYDIHGKRYYDAISSWWTSIWGHNHPYIMKALRKQTRKLDHLIFAGCTHPYATELIEKLSSHIDTTLSRYFFSDDGSTAIEIALKIALQYYKNKGKSKKTRFVHLSDSYHGDTSACMSVGGIDLYIKYYKDLMVESYEIKAPIKKHYKNLTHNFTQGGEDQQITETAKKETRDFIEKNADTIAGIIVEPILMGAAGMQVYSADYLKILRDLANKHDIILIFDEVVTGFGRTGTMWAYEQANTPPDILVLAKGLSAGTLPLALTICTEEIYQAFYDDFKKGKTFYHGHSYTGNPLACSVALANIKLWEKTNPVKNNHFYKIKQLLEESAHYPWVKDIRYKGCTGAVDIGIDRETNFPADIRIGRRIYFEALKKGLFIRPLGDTIYWLFRLNATEKEIEETIQKSIETIDIVVRKSKDELV
ncbi:adenosylmethionine--8-amino-7-oxononanoate transaminase [Spirochaetia bacterium 38H-sp]|uniref:Adenosylmethionine-8-amino-7-oxononanoate aminotransferase n=1 Tax=Rarispira pelagica TaxID=3141764 RepID=A0ABU9UC06_9SPIR